jgi:two-component system NarL family sensor kinase
LLVYAGKSYYDMHGADKIFLEKIIHPILVNSMIQKILLSAVFCALPLSGLMAQTKPVLDSMIVANERYANDDTSKVRMLINLAEAYRSSNASKALEIAEQAVALVNKINAPNLLGEALAIRGLSNSSLQNKTVAIAQTEEAILAFQRVGNKIGIGKCYINLAKFHNHLKNFDQSLDCSDKGLKIFTEIDYKSGIATCLNNKGLTNTYLSRKDEALMFYNKALDISIATADNTNVITSYSNIGLLYLEGAEYTKALEFFNKALKICERYGTVNEHIVLFNNIGSIHFRMSDYKKAIEYDQLVLDQLRKNNITDEVAYARAYINMGTKYRSLVDFPNAMKYYLLALPLVEKPDLKSYKAICLSNIGTVYQAQGDYELALQYHNNALPVFEALKNKRQISRTLINLGITYSEMPDSSWQKTTLLDQPKLTLAKEKLEAGIKLAESAAQKDLEMEGLSFLSKNFEQMGEYADAYRVFRKYIAIKDSISGDEVKKQITRKEIQYEFDKKEVTLKLEQQLTLEQLEQQKLLSLQQQQSLRLNAQSLALSNKEKDLQRLAYLKEKAEKQEKEQALSLVEKDKLLQDVQLGSLLQEKALQLKSLAEKNALIGFLFAGLAAILLGFAAFYWWIRQRQANKVAATQALFTRQLLENIEEDRGRIAIDLHDSVSHDLLLLKQSIRKEITGPEVGDKIDNIINGIRQISRNMHPVMLDKIGLRLSLETLCEQFMQHEKMFVSHQINYQNTLSKSAELQLFRIVQEGLTNALKYSKAEAVKVQLEQSGNTLRLEIEDNGRGFDVEKALEDGKAFGLHSILQRAKAIGGRAEIRSGEKGTIISVVVG